MENLPQDKLNILVCEVESFSKKKKKRKIYYVGIRQLQCILLKIALILGVEIYQNVTFINVIEPTSTQQGMISFSFFFL